MILRQPQQTSFLNKDLLVERGCSTKNYPAVTTKCQNDLLTVCLGWYPLSSNNQINSQARMTKIYQMLFNLKQVVISMIK